MSDIVRVVGDFLGVLSVPKPTAPLHERGTALLLQVGHGRDVEVWIMGCWRELLFQSQSSWTVLFPSHSHHALVQKCVSIVCLKVCVEVRSLVHTESQEILDLGKLEMDCVWSCRRSCRTVFGTFQ